VLVKVADLDHFDWVDDSFVLALRAVAQRECRALSPTKT
jgi:hypothetical protein